jgi:predicted tellurium resistance membrane protein TerC
MEDMFLMTIPDFSQPGIWISLFTLTFLEIVLGIDNIIFISIVANKLPASQQRKARQIGLLLAMGMRILLLFTITWVMTLENNVITLPFFEDPESKNPGDPLSLNWRDIILIVGGIFLLIKSTLEIHHKLEKATKPEKSFKATAFGTILIQIVLIDIIFSMDSILTAVGLVENKLIMILAVVISIGVMMIFASSISRFINNNPSLQVLALAFLIAIGILLVANGFHHEIPKGYIYSALAFSLIVEFINIRLRKKSTGDSQ